MIAVHLVVSGVTPQADLQGMGLHFMCVAVNYSA